MGRHITDWVLTVCAAGTGVSLPGVPPLLVCGRPPGHDGPHRDAVWPVEWDGTAARADPAPAGWIPSLPVRDLPRAWRP